MFIETIGLGFYERRAMPAASALHRLVGRFIHGANVLAVDLYPGHSVAVRSFGYAGLPMTACHRCRDRVAIVLADVDDRQLPERGHVQRLVEGTLIDRSIAKEAQAHLVGASHFGGQAAARSQWNAASDNRGLSDDADALIGQMH